MKKSLKILSVIMAVVLVFACGVGGTLAYLAAKTDEVKNTFTFGDLSVKLVETQQTYTIVPGVEIPKDPKASVEVAGTSEKVDAWLFVEVTEENWPDVKVGEGPARKVDYDWGDGWTELTAAAHDNVKVIYREVATTEYSTPYPILEGNHVTVDASLTKAEVAAAKVVGTPTLTFRAYAVQQAGLETPEKAWAQVGTAVLVSNP